MLYLIHDKGMNRISAVPDYAGQGKTVFAGFYRSWLVPELYEKTELKSKYSKLKQYMMRL
jgi:hypothetical protein